MSSEDKAVAPLASSLRDINRKSPGSIPRDRWTAQHLQLLRDEAMDG